MKLQDLMSAHKYDEVIVDSRRQLKADPENRAAMAWIADALQAKGALLETIEWLERLDSLRSNDKEYNIAVPGHSGFRVRIACLHWLSGERAKAISHVRGSVAGILDGAIKYADAAGGMTQGLLLYYMSITAKLPAEASYALNYLRDRVAYLRKLVGGRLSGIWPCPVAQYLLGDVAFESVLEEVEKPPKLAVPDASARIEIGRRNRLMMAFFFDGVKSRVAGHETQCLSRMREAYLLENQSLIWLLARHEIEQASKDAS